MKVGVVNDECQQKAAENCLAEGEVDQLKRSWQMRVGVANNDC